MHIRGAFIVAHLATLQWWSGRGHLWWRFKKHIGDVLITTNLNQCHFSSENTLSIQRCFTIDCQPIRGGCTISAMHLSGKRLCEVRFYTGTVIMVNIELGRPELAPEYNFMMQKLSQAMLITCIQSRDNAW